MLKALMKSPYQYSLHGSKVRLPKGPSHHVHRMEFKVTAARKKLRSLARIEQVG